MEVAAVEVVGAGRAVVEVAVAITTWHRIAAVEGAAVAAGVVAAVEAAAAARAAA
eukprot:COSAG06_NODE_58535_length_276_cov_3.480226_1_plen_54_part_01